MWFPFLNHLNLESIRHASFHTEQDAAGAISSTSHLPISESSNQM
jgi:hypothetical protein